MVELENLGVPELRKLGRDHKVKDYNNLKRTELVRELRKVMIKPITNEDIISKGKEWHKMLCEKVQQRQAKKQGFTSYLGIQNQVRSLITKIEKLSE